MIGFATMFPAATTQIRAIPLPTQAAAEAVTTCLSASEQRVMAKYRHPRRRLEFVAGRLALKRALLETQGPAVRIGSAAPLPQTLLPAAQRMQVLPDDDGRPRLWVENTVAPTQLSIAHAAGWAVAACSRQPIGVDIVDIDIPTAVPDDHPWLTAVEPEWRVRLRALLWGLRECLLKTGQSSATNLWSLNDIQAVPVRPAGEIVAHWPGPSRLALIDIEVDKRLVAGAFVPLSRAAMLVMILVPAPHSTNGTHIQ